MPLPLHSNPSQHITEKIWNRLVQRSSAGLKIVEGSEPHATTVQLFPIPLELIYEVCLRVHSTKNSAYTPFRHQILWNLGPNDLLNPSRTNKSFRALLLDHSCDVYWTAALAAYPSLPDRPPDMALLSYAGLVFETYCHARRSTAHDCAHGRSVLTPLQNCLSDEVCQVYWIPLVRLCKGCLETL